MGNGESSGPVLHAVGSRVWLADKEEGWAKGEVVAIEDSSRLTVRMEDGSQRVCSQDEIPLQNPGVRGVEVRLHVLKAAARMIKLCLCNLSLNELIFPSLLL